MAPKKWLNIVVDGSSALEAYWPQIVSEYLVKIVRSFYSCSTEGANHASCELGLVMYNANSDLGLNIQYIHWTRDVDYFLDTLSCLAFEGDNLTPHSLVEGFAEALAMFPRPSSNKMTTQEYYDGERHCLIVTASDPIPRRTLVSVPRIPQHNYGGTQLETLKANFLELAQMFVPLAISFSIITPKQHPIFRVLFNLGNNDSSIANSHISDYRVGELTLLFSKNFKEANEVLYEKRILDFLFSDESEESMKTTLPLAFTGADQENLFSIENLTIEGQIVEAAKDDRVEASSPLSLVVPNDNTNETQVPSQSMNIYDDILAEITDKDIFLPRKKSKTYGTIMEEETLKDLFQQDQSIPFDDSLGKKDIVFTEKQFSLEVLKAVEEESRQVLRDIAGHSGAKNKTSTIDLTSNSPMVSYKTSTFNAGEGSSKGLVQELGGNKGVVNPTLNLENCSGSSLLLPQNDSNLWPNIGPKTCNHRSGTMSTTVKLGLVDPWNPQSTNSLFGDSIFPNAIGNSPIQNQPHSSLSSSSIPMLPYGSGHRHAPRYEQYQMTGFGPLGIPAIRATNTWVPPAPIRPQFNPRDFWPPPPSFTNFLGFVHAWEGSLVGKIHGNRISFNIAKALRRATSSFALTVHWSIRLEIALFVPKKAVNYTMKICHGPIDYVFFHILQFNNLDLYEHLMSKNLCAKIDRPFQTIILSPTESKYHFIGTVFPGDTIFVEPL